MDATTIEKPKKVITIKPKTSSPEATPHVESNKIFQAIGVLRSHILLSPERITIIVEGKEYPLYYIKGKQHILQKLIEEIATTRKTEFNLVVYPRVIHFPLRDKDYEIGFQLVGFQSGEELEGVVKELKHKEFRICGIWQFIPVCQSPCISVFKNFDKKRLAKIKEMDAPKKVSIMKASHIPVNGRLDVRPFRFNPKAETQQDKYFVEAITVFDSERNNFRISRLLDEPTTAIPRFLKARKEDKEAALKEKKKKNRQSLEQTK